MHAHCNAGLGLRDGAWHACLPQHSCGSSASQLPARRAFRLVVRAEDPPALAARPTLRVPPKPKPPPTQHLSGPRTRQERERQRQERFEGGGSGNNGGGGGGDNRQQRPQGQDQQGQDRSQGQDRRPQRPQQRPGGNGAGAPALNGRLQQRPPAASAAPPPTTDQRGRPIRWRRTGRGEAEDG